MVGSAVSYPKSKLKNNVSDGIFIKKTDTQTLTGKWDGFNQTEYSVIVGISLFASNYILSLSSSLLHVV